MAEIRSESDVAAETVKDTSTNFLNGTDTASTIDPYGSPTQRTAPDNQVGHFVDTQFASATGYLFLDHNRSELFYVYAIFENGGL